MALWKQKGADSLVTGSVTPLADGRFDVRLRLWDVLRGQDLGGQSYAVAAADLRLSAHRISDFVYEKLTGDKGIFSTRIAYVTKGGQRYTLWVADADGENAQSALASPEPIISPAWSPNGMQLAYVSFESRKPVIYAHDVASGKRRLLANFRGSNSAPASEPLEDASTIMSLLAPRAWNITSMPPVPASNTRTLTRGWRRKWPCNAWATNTPTPSSERFELPQPMMVNMGCQCRSQIRQSRHDHSGLTGSRNSGSSQNCPCFR